MFLKKIFRNISMKFSSDPMKLYDYAISIKKTDKEKAKRLLLEVIASGIALANCDLGIIFIEENDYDSAYQCFKKAESIPEGKYNIALLTQSGLGVKKDLKLAFDLFIEVAELGLTRAYFDVAISYEKGMGVEKNIKEAIKWYKKSANVNDAFGQCNLGTILANLGYVDDAIKCWNLSAKNGNTVAKLNLCQVEVKKD